MPKFQPIIGLEVHIQLKTASKMFCASINQTEGAEPNTNICEVCTGQPGSLPVANQEAIEKTILLGLALNCEIPEYSKFDRKNYFYPDLPKGYQISQYDKPLCGKGQLELVLAGQPRTIRITRAHLEEDAGKLLHPAGANYSLVDLNRAGVPLVEVVTEPDFHSAAEARAFLQQLRTLARYLGISDADMEKGHLRCDANISLQELKEGESLPLPDYKIEIKNMNSFKAVEDALNYEIKRQTEEIAAGTKLSKQTRGWVEGKRATLAQREKEGSEDYRYFPEPDLPVLHFTQQFIDKIAGALPELPQQKKTRFVSEFSLPEKVAWQLVENKELGEYFETVVSELQEWFSMEKVGNEKLFKDYVKEAANWCLGPFSERLNEANIAPAESKVTPENFAELLKMVARGEVSKTAAKDIFGQMFATGDDPSNILEEKGLGQVSDLGEIQAVVEKVLADNAKVVADFQAGKKQALGFLVGKVMSQMSGKANPQMVNKILLQKLR